MKRLTLTLLLLGWLASRGGATTDDAFDRLDDALTVSSADAQMRLRLSGTLDAEGYLLQQPPPALIYTSGEALFAPRLTLFLDVQLGPMVYLFAQSRVDRGFDPTDGPLRGRLDEYALRFTPSSTGVFNFQIGKFATLVGNWARRHGSWENPFVTAPLPYENPTAIWGVAAARAPGTLLRWAHVRPRSNAAEVYSDKVLREPVIWGPSYTSGAAISGEVDRFDYGIEVKNASLSSHPGMWTSNADQWDHPTVSGRVGYRPDERWNFGFSASMGSYLVPAARVTIAPGTGVGDYREHLLGQDVSFAWHHWQLWAEAYETRFEIPTVATVSTVAYYVEAKYKFTPQFFGAVRWNQQVFSEISDFTGARYPWGHDLWRIDVAPTYRFTAHIQAKLQVSLQHDAIGPRADSVFVAGQFTVRF